MIITSGRVYNELVHVHVYQKGEFIMNDYDHAETELIMSNDYVKRIEVFFYRNIIILGDIMGFMTLRSLTAILFVWKYNFEREMMSINIHWILQEKYQ